MEEQSKIAVLIDGDNAESALIERVLAEAGKYGKVTIKRIYADWTQPRMKSWKEKLNEFAIRPSQKFAYTTGKNSTDTALIIDAMDLLHSKYVGGFCIVSSDSDYTGLAHRIREEGMFVMGIGRSGTPIAFVKACENFTYTEILVPNIQIDKQNKNAEKDAAGKNTSQSKLQGTNIAGKIDVINSLKDAGIKSINIQQIETAFNNVVDDDTGLALLSNLGSSLKKLDPTFDPRNFGFNSFRKFCESLAPDYTVVIHHDGSTLSLKRKEE